MERFYESYARMRPSVPAPENGPPARSPAHPPLRTTRLSEFSDTLLDHLVHFLLPAWCLGCEKPLSRRDPALCLCRACRAKLKRPRRERCPLCGAVASTRPGAWLCAACRLAPPAFDGLHAEWSYEPPFDEVIRGLKYHRLEFLADDLARGMAADLRGLETEHDVVTAVPLHWRRRLERGYNQAQLIAKPLARRLGLPYRRLLIRSVSSAPQTTLSARERRSNVEDIFRCRRGVEIHRARVLLIDDVATTGATLDAASRTLKSAGADLITAAVSALTPNRRE